MPRERLLFLALPRLDEKQADRAGCIERKSCDAGIDPPESLFAAVGVTGLRAQGPDALGDGSWATKNLAHILLDFS